MCGVGPSQVPRCSEFPRAEVKACSQDPQLVAWPWQLMPIFGADAAMELNASGAAPIAPTGSSSACTALFSPDAGATLARQCSGPPPPFGLVAKLSEPSL